MPKSFDSTENHINSPLNLIRLFRRRVIENDRRSKETYENVMQNVDKWIEDSPKPSK